MSTGFANDPIRHDQTVRCTFANPYFTDLAQDYISRIKFSIRNENGEEISLTQGPLILTLCFRKD